MKTIFKIILLSSFLFASCNKNDDNGAGIVLTGKNRLIVEVVHHTYPVAGINVWLKNNANEFPGTDTTLYEWKTVSDNSGVAVFEKLFEGNYFLYAKGFDIFIGEEVVGAAQAILNPSTITDNEVYVTLYVTE